MTTNKKATLANNDVAKSASEPALSKHDQTALDAANTHTKNDGSHIAKQRAKLIANATANQANANKTQETK